MKITKLSLLTLLSASVSSAGTTAATFTITGTLSPSCSVSVASNITLTDISVSSTGTSSLTVTCRVGTDYTMTSQSLNGWRLKSGATSATSYSITATGTLPGGVVSAWSGTPGTTTPVNLTAASQIGSATGTVYNFSVTNVAAPLTVTDGSYTDQVTITVNYV